MTCDFVVFKVSYWSPRSAEFRQQGVQRFVRQEPAVYLAHQGATGTGK